MSITALVGMVGVVEQDLGTAYVSQHICMIRPRTNRIAPKWLAYFLLSASGQRCLRINLYGGTKEGLGLDDVGNVSVPVPRLDEQFSIVSDLDSHTDRAEKVVACLRRAIELLREYRSSLISAAVTGQIDVRTHRKEPEALLEAV